MVEIETLKGAIFDMDGTLTDSMYIWDTAGETYLRNQGKVPAPDLREQLRPLSLTQAAELFQVQYGITAPVDEILKGFDGVVENEYRHHVTLKPGALELLEYLKNKGLEMTVATSSPRTIVLMVLKRLGILPYFSHVITCGDVGFGKDHPAVYHRAAELMESDPSHTLVFEDALHAVTTASKAGYFVVGVYDKSEGINEDQIMPLCDLYLKSLTEFPRD
ncbi:MAG: HAD family phosphatase [Firmicutes bacterium]|jgi:HAD superfamily hydrolase (TIGR01509 family)|nr:HAD family phosphatase [Bacillota bacterium]NBI64975.1 HAD family phosphatase [Clostridiales bacterium]